MRIFQLVALVALGAAIICGDTLTTGPVGSPEWIQVRYGSWGGPGVPHTSGPMDSILLKDYAPRSSLVIQETYVARAKHPVIDVHTHVTAQTPEQVREWVRTMDEVGIQTSVILTMATGAKFDKLVDLYLKPYPGRFQLYCGIETRDSDKPDYPQRAVAELVRCYHLGARGTGELIDKGSGFNGDAKLPASQRLHPDDPRLDAFWDKCGELNLPVSLHVADHPSAWTPLDVYQERSPDFQGFNQYGKDVPSWQQLIDMRNRMLARHPRTRVIACHLGNQGHDLASLAAALDKYPNLYVDISARDYEIGRTPRAAARFLERYRTRILFGTDMGRDPGMFRAWWRLLETEDEFMPGRGWWRYYGLGLPDPVLESLYRGNALRLLNWGKM